METTVEMTHRKRWKVTNTVMKGTSVELRGMVWSNRVKNTVKVKNKVKQYCILSPDSTGIRKVKEFRTARMTIGMIVHKRKYRYLLLNLKVYIILVRFNSGSYVSSYVKLWNSHSPFSAISLAPFYDRARETIFCIQSVVCQAPTTMLHFCSSKGNFLTFM